MSKVNVNIDTKNDSAQEIINKLLKPVTEKMEAKLAAITDKLNALESDLNDESDAEATAADASVEAEPVKEEAKAEEIKMVYGAIMSSKPDDKLVAIKSLEALKDVANGTANKVFIPFDATKAMGALGALSEVSTKKTTSK